MKLFWKIVLLLLLMTKPVDGAVAVVQSIQAQSSGQVTSITTGSITTTSGRLIICDVATRSDFGLSQINDSKGNTYSYAISPTASSADTAFRVFQSYANNIVGGASHNFTVPFDDQGHVAVVCKEVSGALTSNALDVTAIKVDNLCTTGCTSTATAPIAQVNELLAGGGAIGVSGTGTTSYTAQSGFTANGSLSNEYAVSIGLIGASLVVSTGGGKTFTFDLSQEADGVLGWITTWKADTGAAAVSARRRIISGD